ncbi:syntaxin 16 [Strigomonas culicis]|uniref:Syntaxin 16 n=1 Tax=Strigomonas culicis TaxID=28005 RepID=S9V8C6_9TRYP|nr:syntaxin 16 [Strigomonas culicis]|eukprot:EPY37053.1 syntaxin 16 [Strigomonas culicis]
MQSKVEKQADEIQKLLRELDRMVQVSMVPQDKNNEEEQMISVNAKKLLSVELQKLIQAFKLGQEYYGNGLKSREKKLKKYTKIGTDDAYEQVKQEERVSRFMAMGYTDADIQELLLEESLQEDVSSEIKAILDSVKELNEMFQDLHELVVEQGTMLDRIDYNLEQAHVHTTKGVKELKKAQDARKHRRVL